jgi:hypothetical protein
MTFCPPQASMLQQITQIEHGEARDQFLLVVKTDDGLKEQAATAGVTPIWQSWAKCTG